MGEMGHFKYFMSVDGSRSLIMASIRFMIKTTAGLQSSEPLESAKNGISYKRKLSSK